MARRRSLGSRLAAPIAWLAASAALATGCGDARRGPAFTVASQNILLGAFCAPGTDGCRLEDRVALFFDLVRAAGCPDAIALQESTPAIRAAVDRHLADACPTPYRPAPGRVGPNSVLSQWPILEVHRTRLFLGIRELLQVRIDHPLGPVDVFTTHLAATIDGGPDPCGESCPAECVAAGAATIRDCQAVQVARLVAEAHDLPTPAFLTGDFNSAPGSFVYRQTTARGWIDAYRAAGNPECDPATGRGCTCCGFDEGLDDLESAALPVTERVDFVFLIPPARPGACVPRLTDPEETAAVATRLLAGGPNPFAPRCGPRPDPICWASDHIGVTAGVHCR